MGIFSRLGEIINANINAMLDKAEDPNKMVKLMINEMEDTLTEIKSSAAEVIAERIRVVRGLDSLREKEANWEAKAELAVSKGRDDLARDALEQKLIYRRQAKEVAQRLSGLEEMVRQYQSDIERLESQLQSAFARQRELEAKRKRLHHRQRTDSYFNTRDAYARFEAFNRQMDRLEAESEVQGFAQNNSSLEQKFAELEQSGEVEEELAKLKKRKPIEKA